MKGDGGCNNTKLEGDGDGLAKTGPRSSVAPSETSAPATDTTSIQNPNKSSRRRGLQVGVGAGEGVR